MPDAMQKSQLQQIVEGLLHEARRQGADSAEAGAQIQQGLAVNVRMGEVDTIEHASDQGLGLTVYRGQRKGTASTSDFSVQAIKETVAAACRIARYTSEDSAAGLADAALMATEIPDLELNHPWAIDAEQALRIAQDCEAAALAHDARITNSEGAGVNTRNSLFVYGNTHGFIEGYPTTRHSISCAVLAKQNDDMQRDAWYTTDRSPADLQDARAVGIEAGRRSLERLGSRKLSTMTCPVLFKADAAVGLLRHLISAIRGSALYHRASFLLDKLGHQIFPDWVMIDEDPLRLRGLRSAPFDGEGVATRPRYLVTEGVLRGYVLESYSARKLGMQTTGNAGGVRNLRIQDTGQSFDELVRQMHRGLVVTELMGQGSNLVTGDYSRGAAGFWVEHGEVQYPVEEVTVAGNLQDMFSGLLAVGIDNQIPGSVQTGSWLIERMTVAGVD